MPCGLGRATQPRPSREPTITRRPGVEAGDKFVYCYSSARDISPCFPRASGKSQAACIVKGAYTVSAVSAAKRLALEGGTPAVRAPLPPMYPGGLRIGREEEEAVLEVIRAKRLFRHYGPEPGPSKVDELERAFAECIGTEYSLAVSSGSAALSAGLAALQVGPGDEVIVPAYTWISTPAAVGDGSRADTGRGGRVAHSGSGGR